MRLTLLDALVFVALSLLIIGALAASTWADRYLELTIAAALDDPFDPMDGDPVARAEEILADHDRFVDWQERFWWDG